MANELKLFKCADFSQSFEWELSDDERRQFVECLEAEKGKFTFRIEKVETGIKGVAVSCTVVD